MKRRILKSPAAVRDLIDHATFLGERSPQSAARFVDAVENTLDLLLATPDIGGVYETDHPRLANLRVWRIRGFAKHLVFYRSTERSVEVIRILHGSRDIAAILSPRD